MQVISGKFRGRRLVGVPTDQTRPTLGRVKENIFNMIADRISEATVLDLFAGSGALGIECLSRGAKKVVFVDTQAESISTIKRNLKNDTENVELIKQDYIDAMYGLAKREEKFNLVLLDPPFASDFAEKALYYLHKLNLLKDGATVMLETSSKKELQNFPQKYIIEKSKTYGTIGVRVIKYNKEQL